MGGHRTACNATQCYSPDERIYQQHMFLDYSASSMLHCTYAAVSWMTTLMELNGYPS